jgi:hypothetical protein
MRQIHVPLTFDRTIHKSENAVIYEDHYCQQCRAVTVMKIVQANSLILPR